MLRVDTVNSYSNFYFFNISGLEANESVLQAELHLYRKKIPPSENFPPYPYYLVSARHYQVSSTRHSIMYVLSKSDTTSNVSWHIDIDLCVDKTVSSPERSQPRRAISSQIAGRFLHRRARFRLAGEHIFLFFINYNFINNYFSPLLNLPSINLLITLKFLSKHFLRSYIIISHTIFKEYFKPLIVFL